jgi:hypothetical protein
MAERYLKFCAMNSLVINRFLVMICVIAAKLRCDFFVAGSTLSASSVKNIATEAYRDGGAKHVLEVLTVLRRQHFLRTGKHQYNFDASEYKNWYELNRVTLNPKRNGIAAVSSIINDRNRVIMCTIPKVMTQILLLQVKPLCAFVQIDSSTWRRIMLYLEHPELARSSSRSAAKGSARDPHNIKKNGVKIMAHQAPEIAASYYNNETYLKAFQCRNPLTRLLSAWLSKNANSSNPLEFAAPFHTFRDFVTVII